MKIENVEPTARNFRLQVVEGKHTFTYSIEVPIKGKTFFVTKSRCLVKSREFKPNEEAKQKRFIAENIKQFM